MDRINAGAQPLDEMCGEIVAQDHVLLHRLIPQIRDELSGLPAGTTLNAIRATFGALADQIESHLSKEEHLLFPVIEALAAADRETRSRPASPFATMLHPIRLLESEHARIESMLEQLYELSLELAEPDSCAPGWRRFLSALCRLDAAIREHHRTENEVLFPRALDIERRLL